jgi:flagellar assembly protein FliH
MRKFAFDTSFDDPTSRPSPVAELVAVPETVVEIAPEPPPEPVFSAEELQAARAAAWNDGMAAGRDEAEAGLQARRNRMIENMTTQLGQLLATTEAAASSVEQDAVRIGVAVVRALYPYSFREEARLEIIRAIRDVLQAQENGAAQLCLTIAAADEEWLTPALAAFGSQRFRLRIENAMTAGDFRLEWADGGLERLQADIWQRITALLPETNKESNT